MNQEQLDFFKELLSQQLQALLHQSGDTVAGILNQEHIYSDPLDRASFDEDQSRKLRIRDRESYLIRKINKAFDRIEDGSYGICETCEEAISFRRLMARPVATKCISCKTQEEKLERAFGR